MKQMEWKPFPYGDRAYRYSGAALEEQWSRLHHGDREPFPDAELIAEQLNRCGRALSHDADPNKISSALQSAWRDYHAGDFAAAMRTGLAFGPVGAVVAGRAAIAYAMHLESDAARALELLCQAARQCEELTQIDPGSVNGWFIHALALARFSQRISIVKALGRGIGSKVRQSLMTAIALEPEHASAHAALGAYNLEVIDKVGTVVGHLTHGASREAGLQHFQRAIELDPDSPATRMEFARALAMGRRRRNEREAEKNIAVAATCLPFDATARLDVERARYEMHAI
ncbi:MAG: hypothetical protein KDE68_02355 [Rhodocyclaceae bacterium]|nr:hypothetical protein [Rhodocyclaceae bacterium]